MVRLRDMYDVGSMSNIGSGGVKNQFTSSKLSTTGRLRKDGTRGFGRPVEVYDFATPRLEAVESGMGFLMAPYFQVATQALRTQMVKSFNVATIESRPNTKATKDVKGGGKPPLIDSGDLKDSVMGAQTQFRILDGGENCEGIYSLSFPEAGQRVYTDRMINGMVRKRPNFPYVWSHEFGTRSPKSMKRFGYLPGKWRVPRRPFIKKGLKAGMESARSIVNAGLVNVVAEMNGLGGLRLPYPRFDLSKELQWSGYDTISMFSPPTALYAVGGRISDFTSSLEGSFGLAQLGPWFTAWGMGTVGLTKKVQRRKMRRRIWA